MFPEKLKIILRPLGAAGKNRLENSIEKYSTKSCEKTTVKIILVDHHRFAEQT